MMHFANMSDLEASAASAPGFDRDGNARAGRSDARRAAGRASNRAARQPRPTRREAADDSGNRRHRAPSAAKTCRTCRSRSPRSAPRRSTNCRSTRSTITPSSSPHVSFQSSGPGIGQRLFPRRRIGRERQPFGLAAHGRHLSRRTADHHHPGRARHPRLRHRPGRGAGRAAGHVVRRVEPGRHDPDHHQQARLHRPLRRRQPGSEQASPTATSATPAKASSTCRSRATSALRVVGWYRHDAGYIDNIAGSAAPFRTIGHHRSTMTALVEDDYNDVTPMARAPR